MQQAKFSIGQIVHHKLFNYRGVVIDVDFQFLGDDEWYDKIALSCPPKDQPWYHVLVDNTDHQTYVAERNLEESENPEPLNHPFIDRIFEGVENGCYKLRVRTN